MQLTNLSPEKCGYCMQEFEAFKELLNSPKSIVIVTHHKPDADALGSSLGLYQVLTKKKHSVTVITPTDYPKFLHWMEGNEQVLIFNEGNQIKSQQLIEAADIIFCLDFSSLHRINELGDYIKDSSAKKVLIDHHLDPEDFADFTFWSQEAAATAELIYELLIKIGYKHLIDPQVAESLYAGIMTDTGSFRHSNTSPKVHRITAELMELGADTHQVSRRIYDSNSYERLKFTGFALSERLVILPEFNTAYMAVSNQDLARFNSKTGDTEGLVNHALSISGIVLAAVIIDRGEVVKISFRSIGDFPANQLAQDHFEGGGHLNAAGGRSNLSLEKTVEKFIDVLPLYKSELNANTKINANA